MQEEQRPAQTMRRPTRLVKYAYPSHIGVQSTVLESAGESLDVAAQPTTRIEPVSLNNVPNSDPGDISNQVTHLMQLSGMLRPIRVPQQQAGDQNDTVLSKNRGSA